MSNRVALLAPHQHPGAVKQKHFSPGLNIQIFQRTDHIHTVAGGKTDRRTDWQPRLNHISNQGSLHQQAVGTLHRQIVARRVEIENAHNQDVERNQVEGDDLSGERGVTKAEPAALGAAGIQFSFVQTIRCDKIIAKDKVVILTRLHAPHPYPLDQSHYSSLYRYPIPYSVSIAENSGSTMRSFLRNRLMWLSMVRSST